MDADVRRLQWGTLDCGVSAFLAAASSREQPGTQSCPHFVPGITEVKLHLLHLLTSLPLKAHTLVQHKVYKAASAMTRVAFPEVPSEGHDSQAAGLKIQARRHSERHSPRTAAQSQRPDDRAKACSRKS